MEGFTNPLFTFLSAGLHLLPLSAPTLPLLVQMTSLLLSVGTLLILTRFWGDSPEERFAGLAAAVFYVALPHHNYYAHSGFEVYMGISLLVFALWRIERLAVPGALLVGLLPLTHGTALPMWAVLVVGILLMTGRSLRGRLPLALVAVLPFLCYEVFRIAYYHEILPNTYWLKAGAGSLSEGARYAVGWLRRIWPLALLGAYSLFAVPGRKMILTTVVVVVHLASVVALGGDIFPQFRFLFPCSVLLAALAGASVLPLHRFFAFLPRGERAYFRLAFAGLMLFVLVRKPLAEYRLHAPAYDNDKRWNIRHIAMGLALRDNTPADAVVGLFGLGYTGYYGARFTIDMLGKADAHIARIQPIRGRLVGHNKMDFDYVILQRKPDFLELSFSPLELRNTAPLREKSRSDPWGYEYDLALNPAFGREYAAHPVSDVRGRFIWFYSHCPDGNVAWKIPEEFFVCGTTPDGICCVEKGVSDTQ